MDNKEQIINNCKELLITELNKCNNIHYEQTIPILLCINKNNCIEHYYKLLNQCINTEYNTQNKQ